MRTEQDPLQGLKSCKALYRTGRCDPSTQLLRCFFIALFVGDSEEGIYILREH